MQSSRADDTDPDELLRLAILVEDTDSSFQELRYHPLQLLAWFSPPPPRVESRSTVLAVGKLSTLGTFDHVHEYDGKKGVPLKSTDSQRWQFRHVATVSFSDMGGGRETALMTLNLQARTLERHTGLTRATSPSLLVASSAFLKAYGFFNMELVWVELETALPLSHVILGPRPARGGLLLTADLIEQAMQQLFKMMQEGAVLFRQDMTFSLPATFTLETGEQRHETMEFAVLECSPVLQGQLTENTKVVVVPQEEDEEEGEEEAVSFHLSRRHPFLSQASSEDAELLTSYETKPRSSSVLSAQSASDFHNEEEVVEPCLEVVSVPHLHLHRHYVLLPRAFAEPHELFQFQTVLLVAEQGETGWDGRRTTLPGSTGLDSLVFSTNRKLDRREVSGTHHAIVLWFDGQAELERYVLTSSLGAVFEEKALEVGYVHPFLLYALFHETLSPHRRYSISIKVCVCVCVCTPLCCQLTCTPPSTLSHSASPIFSSLSPSLPHPFSFTLLSPLTFLASSFLFHSSISSPLPFSFTLLSPLTFLASSFLFHSSISSHLPCLILSLSLFYLLSPSLPHPFSFILLFPLPFLASSFLFHSSISSHLPCLILFLSSFSSLSPSLPHPFSFILSLSSFSSLSPSLPHPFSFTLLSPLTFLASSFLFHPSLPSPLPCLILSLSFFYLLSPSLPHPFSFILLSPLTFLASSFLFHSSISSPLPCLILYLSLFYLLSPSLPHPLSFTLLSPLPFLASSFIFHSSISSHLPCLILYLSAFSFNIFSPPLIFHFPLFFPF